nr:GPW/gp25 family protein [Streptomyces sp. CBMA29]
MAIPFALAADGSLAVVQDPAKATSDRVRALVGTLPGQRPMRATYGVPTSEVLFAPDPEVASAELQLMVRDAVTEFEPSAVITTVTPTIDFGLGLVTVDVGVGRADVPSAELDRYQTVSVAVGGEVAVTVS